jgi:hypothetical protein
MPAKPTIEQLRETAQTYDLHLSDADLESFAGLMSATLESYRHIDQLTEIRARKPCDSSGGMKRCSLFGEGEGSALSSLTEGMRPAMMRIDVLP